MRTTRKLKAKTTSFRLDSDLKRPVDEWLHENPGFTLSSLINAALRKFITEKQTLQPVETVKVSDKTFARSLKRMMKQHADTLKQLK